MSYTQNCIKCNNYFNTIDPRDKICPGCTTISRCTYRKNESLSVLGNTEEEARAYLEGGLKAFKIAYKHDDIYCEDAEGTCHGSWRNVTKVVNETECDEWMLVRRT